MKNFPPTPLLPSLCPLVVCASGDVLGVRAARGGQWAEPQCGPWGGGGEGWKLRPRQEPQQPREPRTHRGGRGPSEKAVPAAPAPQPRPTLATGTAKCAQSLPLSQDLLSESKERTHGVTAKHAGSPRHPERSDPSPFPTRNGWCGSARRRRVWMLSPG